MPLKFEPYQILEVSSIGIVNTLFLCLDLYKFACPGSPYMTRCCYCIS